MQLWWSVAKSFARVLVFSAAAAVVVDAAAVERCAYGADAPLSHARVDAALFGIEMPVGEEGDTFFVETNRVPLVAGAAFGWRLRLKDGATQVRLREELELPVAPRIWRHTDDTSISGDRRTAITERLVHPTAGWLENAWSFTAGDPPGRYRLRVYLDDELAREFTFLADELGRTPCHP
jgi:hypothetical protein